MVLPRIAALQPSISVTLAALDRLSCLGAVTKYCVAQVPELASTRLPILADSWNFDEAALAQLRVAGIDLVIASVPYTTQSLETLLRAGIPVLALSPRTLADVYADTRRMAAIVHAADRADAMVRDFERALASAKEVFASRGVQRPTIYCEEWGKPLIHSQPWVYELAQAAGALPLPVHSGTTSAEAIAEANPDIIALAWCGAGDRVPAAKVVEQRNWQHLKAVQNGRVSVIADEWLNTPALPSLTEGLRALSRAMVG